jgi:chromosome segregation ATPase
LQARIDELEDTLRDTEHKLAARHEHIAKFAPQLDEATKELERLRKRAEEAEAENQKTTRKFEEQAEKLAELQQALKDRDERIAELEDQLKAKAADSDRLGAVQKHEQELAEELADAKAEAETAHSARDAAQAELKTLNEKLQQALKDEGKAAELQRKLEARDHQIGVAQQQLTDLRDELKLEEEERARAAEDLRKAREAEERAMEQADALEREVEELKAKLAEAEESATASADGLFSQLEELKGKLAESEDARSSEVASLKEQLKKAGEESDDARELREENAGLKARNDEIARKRDEVLNGLQAAVSELDAMKEVLAERDVDLRTARGERDEALKQADELRRELEGLKALQAEIDALEEKRQQAVDELLRANTTVANTEVAAEKARDEVRALKEKFEQAVEQRHEAEKQLVEARAKLDAEQELRREAKSRIEQLEDALQREREQVDKSAPAEALSSLSAQLANERTKWESRIAERESELEDMRSRLREAEGRESDLAAQLESVELSKQDANRAKALAGQRRAQIERMQSDVETARRQAKDSESYWKNEMNEFQAMVSSHLLAAENKEEGSDKKLQGLLEELGIGIADKYAKLRKRANRTDKELEETKDKLQAVERILAKREEEDSRVKKIVKELEAPKKKATRKKK